MNFQLAPAELGFIVEDSDTVALVVDDAHLELGRQLRDGCDSLRLLIYAGNEAVPDDAIAYESCWYHSGDLAYRRPEPSG